MNHQKDQWDNARVKVTTALYSCAGDYDNDLIEHFPYHLNALKRVKCVIAGFIHLPTHAVDTLLSNIEQMESLLIIKLNDKQWVDQEQQSEPVQSKFKADLSSYVQKIKTAGRPKYVVQESVLREILGKGLTYDQIAKNLGISTTC